MTFFDPISTRPPKFVSGQAPLPWEEGLGRTVFSDVLLGHGPDGIVMMRNLIAFPRVMTFAVVALLRKPLGGAIDDTSPMFGPSFRDEPPGAGIVLLGLRFSDGTELRNLDEVGSLGWLESIGGGSRPLTGEHEFVAPIPPPGELEVWAAWPAAQIPETRTTLNGSAVGETGAGLQSPWQ